jgi:hypothetical protein
MTADFITVAHQRLLALHDAGDLMRRSLELLDTANEGAAVTPHLDLALFFCDRAEVSLRAQIEAAGSRR